MSKNSILVAAILYLVATTASSCSKDDGVEEGENLPGTEVNEGDETAESDYDEYHTNSQQIPVENAVQLAFSSSGVVVTNPYESQGVTITKEGAHVVITSTLTDLELTYILSGVTANGSVKMYGEKKFSLVLNGVSIHNPTGAAINNQCTKKMVVTLVDKTNNRLIDGAQYTYKEGEDMKATLFSEGNLELNGTGSLEIAGKNKHALCVDGALLISQGAIRITDAVSDGIHANDEITVSGGTVTVNAVGDGLESESKTKPTRFSGGTVQVTTTGEKGSGIKSKFNVDISTEGSVSVTVKGEAAKGIKTTGDFIMTQGELVLVASGIAIWDTEELDMSTAAGVKSDGNINISGGTIHITASGQGSKGLSAEKDVTITGGTIDVTCSGNGAKYTNSSGVADSYSAAGIKATGNINLGSSKITLSDSGSGGKGMVADGSVVIGSSSTNPIVNITTTGGKFLVSGSDYCLPKALRSKGTLTVESGTITISSADDGIKSDQMLTFNGGNVTVSRSVEGLESVYINVNGGYLDITASNDAVNTTKGTVSGGTESNDGSLLKITGGTLVATCTAGDAIDSNGSVLMDGGMLIATGPSSGVEEAIDVNGTFTINGGLCLACGSNSNMTKALSTTSTQSNFYLSTSGIQAGTLVHVAVEGSEPVTFKPKAAAYKFHISNQGMTKGAGYTISTGGSYAGGTTTGSILCTGGSYSGGTVKKTGTLSTSSTVNSVSF